MFFLYEKALSVYHEQNILKKKETHKEKDIVI